MKQRPVAEVATHEYPIAAAPESRQVCDDSRSQRRSDARSPAVSARLEVEKRKDRRETDFARPHLYEPLLARSDSTAGQAEIQPPVRRDGLTGVPNRQSLLEQLQEKVAKATQVNAQFALLYIDFDGFRLVNDRFGHRAGDKLLLLGVTRMQSCVRIDDSVCRCGGDEFVVILSNANRPDAIADRIRRLLAQPYWIEGKQLRVNGSIGIAQFPADGSHGEALLSSADASMCRSKATRRRRHDD